MTDPVDEEARAEEPARGRAMTEDQRMVFRSEFALRLKLRNARSLNQVRDLPAPDGHALVGGHWRMFWRESTVAEFEPEHAARGGRKWRKGRLGGWV